MKKSPANEIGFKWQEIPLEQARNSILAGDGNYAGLKQHLLDKLPEINASNETLPPHKQKTFAFGVPDGKPEVAEDQRRAICMVLNLTLKHADLEWKVTYSGTCKLFICVPKAIGIERSHKNRWRYKKSFEKFNRVIKLYKKKLNKKQIGEELGMPMSTVSYYIAKYNRLLKVGK